MDTTVEARSAPAEAWWRYSTELLACLNSAGVLVRANPAWKTVLELEPDALQGNALAHLVHSEDAARVSAALTWAGTHPDQQFDARCRHARGHHVAMSWSLSRAPDGLLLASARRCTPQATPIAPAGAGDGASARLQRVLAMGRLAGGVAHDFNNLLQALRNALELVRRQPADAAGVQRLSESALRVLDHGAHLTAQLLASSGAQRLQLTALPVGPFLRGMRSVLERSLPPKITLQMHVAPDAGSVMADPDQLQSAVLNLVLNACDAMEGLAQGGPVTLSCDRTLLAGDNELPTGEYLRLSATDVGNGMSDAVRERAFEPFFTTRPLAEGGHGRGLGLSQVHGFSRQCGGTTRILSTGPQGTTVCMLLPVLATPASAPAQPSPPWWTDRLHW
jgi:signal transduction histidine kinase